MTCSISAWDYFGGVLFCALIPMALFLLISIPLMRLLLRRTKNIGLALLPMLLIFPTLFLEFAFVMPAAEHIECLYPEERAYTHTTAGTVTDLRTADHIPLYFCDGEFRGGVHVTIDGTEYYTMAHPMLIEGISLHFTYYPDQNLIAAFTPIAQNAVDELRTPFVMSEPAPEEPEEPAPQLQSVIATLLAWAGLFGIGLFITADDWITIRTTCCLLPHDREQRGSVIPNPTSPLAAGIFLIPFCLLILSNALSNNSLLSLFILLLGAPAAMFFPRFCAAHVRLEGRNIHIRRFLRNRTVPLSSLRAVYWDRHRGIFSPRQLILVFDGWSLQLDQNIHYGLEDLHRRLSALLQVTH